MKPESQYSTTESNANHWTYFCVVKKNCDPFDLDRECQCCKFSKQCETQTIRLSMILSYVYSFVCLFRLHCRQLSVFQCVISHNHLGVWKLTEIQISHRLPFIQHLNSIRKPLITFTAQNSIIDAVNTVANLYWIRIIAMEHGYHCKISV